MIRVAHYLNQFFAGIGGEDKADIPLQVFNGPKGPGVLLDKELGGEGEVVSTIFAGDNYANERTDEFLNVVERKLREINPDVIVAGPAFNAGRYGTACGSLLKTAAERLGLPGVTVLSPENPAVEMYRKNVYILPTSGSIAGMAKVLPTLARFALRLGKHLELGPALEEGYLPRGIRRNEFYPGTAAFRAVEMAITRAKKQPFRTELVLIPFDAVAPPQAIGDLSKAIVALVSEGGIVPKGNPDRLETWNATKWFHYSLPGDDFKEGEYEIWHGGVIPDIGNQDPDRNIPLDAMRSLEKEGVIGKLYDEFCVTTGNAGSLARMRQIGKEIADYLADHQVNAVILTGT